MDGRNLREAEANEEGLHTLWGVRRIDPKTVKFQRGTAVSPRHAEEERETGWRDTLPPLLQAYGEPGVAPLRLGEIIGEGGMGVVYRAEQVALRRQVAVKIPQADNDDFDSGSQLLREARITGLLEHPNVVPIYSLGRDDGGRPMIVMRHIQGDSWAKLLNATSISTRAGDDYLNRHLRILQQVAMAVHFAHDKGIVHRDLKPENVLVGSYGEVYVADWGVAVSLAEGNDDIPRAVDVCTIEGTPSYMAPEMAAGDGESIDARTDVYLLGAILHEILTGAAPHQGADLTHILKRAFLSEPTHYGAEVPPELANICHRAMQRFGDDRYPSAAKFSLALERFMEHRAAMELAAEARERLDRLECSVEELCDDNAITIVTDDPAGARAISPTREAKQQIYKLFNECRFAFEHVLRNYPDDNQAKAGLRRTMLIMIHYEMARRSPGAAVALLRELSDPPEDLATEVRRAWAEQRRNDERLKQLERDTDVSFGAKLRSRLVLVVALLWGSSTFALGVLSRQHLLSASHLAFSALNAVFLLIVGTSVLLTRDTMLSTAPNRRLSAISSLVFGGFAILWLLLSNLEISGPHSALIHTLMGAVVWTCAAVAIEGRWLALSAAQCVSFTLIWFFPPYYFEILGVVIPIGSFVTTVLSHNAPTALRSTPTAPSAAGPKPPRG